MSIPISEVKNTIDEATKLIQDFSFMAAVEEAV